MMGVHHCTHPCWHRALILFGTAGYWYGALLLALWLGRDTQDGHTLFWGIAAWLVSTWLCKHLLQWRCQGPAPSDGRRLAALSLLLGSAWLLGRDTTPHEKELL
jgi:hypothetical protein